MNAAAVVTVASKKSGKLSSSSKRKRRKRLESINHNSAGKVPERDIINRTGRDVEQQPALERSAGSNKRPRIDGGVEIKNHANRIDEHFIIAQEKIKEPWGISRTEKEEGSADLEQKVESNGQQQSIKNSSSKDSKNKALSPKTKKYIDKEKTTPKKAQGGTKSVKSSKLSTGFRKLKRKRLGLLKNKENVATNSPTKKAHSRDASKKKNQKKKLESRFDACLEKHVRKTTANFSSENEIPKGVGKDQTNIITPVGKRGKSIKPSAQKENLASPSSLSKLVAEKFPAIQTKKSDSTHASDTSNERTEKSSRKLPNELKTSDNRENTSGGSISIKTDDKTPKSSTAITPKKENFPEHMKNPPNKTQVTLTQGDFLEETVVGEENAKNSKGMGSDGQMKESDPTHASGKSNKKAKMFSRKVSHELGMSNDSNRDSASSRSASNRKDDQANKSSTAITPEKESETGHTTNPSRRKQVTLTQGEFLEETWKEETNTNNARCIKQQNGEHPGMESVEIRKRDTLRETIRYSRGDVWLSADPKYHGVAFTLGYIHVEKMEHEAEISQMWLKLEKTYIGLKQAALIAGNCPDGETHPFTCDWVIVEKHELMPKDKRIPLKSLRDKLSADDLPKTNLYYTQEVPTYSYFYKCDNQFVPPQNKDRPIALDVFAGGGGMSIGLKKAGWNIKYKVDKDTACCRTLRANFPKKKVYNMDITKFLRDLKSGRVKMDAKKIALVHGSPPCQGFSGANTSGGNNDWQNKECTIDFLKVVGHIQPPFVSMENVPGLAMKRKINGAKVENISYLQQVMGKLISLGYNVRSTMILASHYGDPQDRKRLVLLAAKRGYELPAIPKQTHGGDGMEPIVNVQDALKDLEDVETNCSGRVELKNGTIVHGHFLDGTVIAANNDEDERLYAQNPLAPAVTVRKKNNMCHYNLDRYLTILEYKRLMSFPDSHKLEGTRKEMRDQIGNAVPCHFARAIGRTIMESYRLGMFPYIMEPMANRHANS